MTSARSAGLAQTLATMGRWLKAAVCAAAIGLTFAFTGGAGAGTPNWTGNWRITHAAFFQGGQTFVLRQTGSKITGRFSWEFAADKGGFGSAFCFTGKGGTIRGTARGRTLKGTMVYPRRGGHPKSKGSFTATLSRSGRGIVGRGQMQTGECSGVYFDVQARLGKS